MQHTLHLHVRVIEPMGDGRVQTEEFSPGCLWAFQTTHIDRPLLSPPPPPSPPADPGRSKGCCRSVQGCDHFRAGRAGCRDSCRPDLHTPRLRHGERARLPTCDLATCPLHILTITGCWHAHLFFQSPILLTSQLAARIAVSNLHKSTLKSFVERCVLCECLYSCAKPHPVSCARGDRRRCSVGVHQLFLPILFVPAASS